MSGFIELVGLGCCKRLSEVKVLWDNRAGCLTLWDLKDKELVWVSTTALRHNRQTCIPGSEPLYTWWEENKGGKMKEAIATEPHGAHIFQQKCCILMQGAGLVSTLADGSSVFISTAVTQLRWKYLSITVLLLQYAMPSDRVRRCSSISVKESRESCAGFNAYIVEVGIGKQFCFGLHWL